MKALRDACEGSRNCVLLACYAVLCYLRLRSTQEARKKYAQHSKHIWSCATEGTISWYGSTEGSKCILMRPSVAQDKRRVQESSSTLLRRAQDILIASADKGNRTRILCLEGRQFAINPYPLILACVLVYLYMTPCCKRYEYESINLLP